MARTLDPPSTKYLRERKISPKFFRPKFYHGRLHAKIKVSEMASAKNGVRNRVRIDDVGSILRFRIGFPFGENSAGFCRSMWLPGSILNFRIGSVSSIGGLIAATLFAATVSDSQKDACFLLPGFGGPDQSFWPDVRRDIRLKASSLGWVFFSLLKIQNSFLRCSATMGITTVQFHALGFSLTVCKLGAL